MSFTKRIHAHYVTADDVDYRIVVVSEEYGNEDFKYGSEAERDAGLKRLGQKAKQLKDGIERAYYYYEGDIDEFIESSADLVAEFDGKNFHEN